jgi:hypothetical protein
MEGIGIIEYSVYAQVDIEQKASMPYMQIPEILVIRLRPDTAHLHRQQRPVNFLVSCEVLPRSETKS